MKGRIVIDREVCKGCGLCIIACPKERIEISDSLNSKGYYPAEFKDHAGDDPTSNGCIGCSLCAITCPDVAIEVYREEKEQSK